MLRTAMIATLILLGVAAFHGCGSQTAEQKRAAAEVAYLEQLKTDPQPLFDYAVSTIRLRMAEVSMKLRSAAVWAGSKFISVVTCTARPRSRWNRSTANCN